MSKSNSLCYCNSWPEERVGDSEDAGQQNVMAGQKSQ